MYKIIGIGNALVDVMTKLESDDFLKQFSFAKGSMQLVDLDFSNKVLKAAENLPKTLSSGGSAANTIHGLAKLGINSAYIGTIGKDTYGDFFKDDLKNSNIEARLNYSKVDTGRAVALISPDSERTFATYLGAAIELSENNITSSLFEGFDLLHIEGYLVQNHALVEKSVEIAKQKGLKVSLDLASYNVVENNLDFLNSIIKNYVDIVFANEEEAKAISGLSPNDALHYLGKITEIAVVKIGKDGSLVKFNDEVIVINPFKANSIDTTGAGDIYASGFLFGLANGLTLEKCGTIGSLLASNVIEVIGAKIHENVWEKLRDKVREIIL